MSVIQTKRVLSSALQIVDARIDWNSLVYPGIWTPHSIRHLSTNLSTNEVCKVLPILDMSANYQRGYAERRAFNSGPLIAFTGLWKSD